MHLNQWSLVTNSILNYLIFFCVCVPEVIFFYFCVHCRQWLAKKTKSSPPRFFKCQDRMKRWQWWWWWWGQKGELRGISVMCHVSCCTCSTSWCFQGPLVSLALDGKLPESMEWGQGGGCAAAGTQFLRSGCRRPNCSLLACERTWFFFKLDLSGVIQTWFVLKITV